MRIIFPQHPHLAAPFADGSGRKIFSGSFPCFCTKREDGSWLARDYADDSGSIVDEEWIASGRPCSKANVHAIDFLATKIGEGLLEPIPVHSILSGIAFPEKYMNLIGEVTFDFNESRYVILATDFSEAVHLLPE